ncbi:hypothetical protein KEM56_003705, partial [Ascosphaera pollenicola]
KAIDYVDRVAGPKVREVADTMRTKYVTVVEPSAQQMLEKSVPYQEAARSMQVKAKYHANYISTFYAEKYAQYFEPHVTQALSKSHELAVVVRDRAVPYSKQVVSAAISLWTETVRPRITGLYLQNIEPQLVRIGQKLATYREARARGANITDTRATTSDTVEGIPTSTSYVAQSSILPPPDSQQTQSASHIPSSASSQRPAENTAQRSVADDLTEWETKFASSVDKGSAELLKQISDIIAQKRATKPIDEATRLLDNLNEHVTAQFDSVKANIIELITAFPQNATAEDHAAALSSLQEEIMAAGTDIKANAQILREYVSDFVKDLLNEVLAATNNTIDVISNIQTLGIEQIGMKWAWMENVSYEDWSKYNALKKAEPTWKSEVRDIAILHEGLIKLRREADEILSSGMDAVEKAAASLKELHEIGKWKILAEDSSEEFEVREEAPGDVRAARRKELGLDKEDEEVEVDGAGAIDVEAPQKVMGAPAPEVEEEALVEDDAEITKAPSTVSTPDVPSSIPSPSDLHTDISDLLGDPWEPTTEVSGMAIPTTSATAQSSVWGGVAAAEIDPDSIASKYARRMADDDDETYADIDSALNAEKARDVEDFIEQSPSPTTTASSADTDATPSNEPLASQASAQLSSALLAATEALSSATAQATGGPVVLDAKRRYYEAVGIAHDAFSSTIAEPVPTETVRTTSTVSRTTTATATIAGDYDAATTSTLSNLQDAEEEFSAVTSLIAASLDAVLYSISSVSVDAESTKSVIDDATSRYSAALAAATASFGSVSEELQKKGRSTFSPPPPDATGADGEPLYTILPVSETAATARDEL